MWSAPVDRRLPASECVTRAHMGGVCVCVVCVCVYACVGVNGIERQNGVCHVSMTSLR